jgi:hypothetical protein
MQYDKQKNNSFSIQVDESTDFTNKSYVVAFVRFVNDGEIQGNVFPVAKLKILAPVDISPVLYKEKRKS